MSSKWQLCKEWCGAIAHWLATAFRRVSKLTATASLPALQGIANVLAVTARNVQQRVRQARKKLFFKKGEHNAALETLSIALLTVIVGSSAVAAFEQPSTHTEPHIALQDENPYWAAEAFIGQEQGVVARETFPTEEIAVRESAEFALLAATAEITQTPSGRVIPELTFTVPGVIQRAADNAVAIYERHYTDRYPTCAISSEFLIATAHKETGPWWPSIGSNGQMSPALKNAWGAMGPFQFIETSWVVWAADGNGDGITDVQNVFDAAVASMLFQCDLAERYVGGLDDPFVHWNVAVDYHDGPNRSRTTSQRCVETGSARSECKGEIYATGRVEAAAALSQTPLIPTVELAATRGHCDVLIVGDSLTVGTEPYLAEAFAVQGLAEPTVTAEIGRTIQQGVDALTVVNTDVDVVIVALGTNNFFDSRAGVTSAVENLLSEVDIDNVIWVETAYPQAEFVNDIVTFTGVPTVVDPSFEHYTAEDGIHLTGTGYEHRAALYADIAARACM